jgi:hypothetical protein
MANDVQYVALIGSESVEIIDRKPAGTLVFEAPALSDHDYFEDVANQTAGVMSINHGSRTGYKVNVSCPNVILGNPSYQDYQGIAMLSAPFTIIP